MKPKDLKSPFSWDKRTVLIHDHVWFIPEYYNAYETFTFPGWEALFGNDRHVKVEYCSGNGEWIVNKALQQPECNWVAVEKKFERVRKIWSKIKNQQVENLLIVSGDAVTVTKNYLPQGSIEEIFINFPDPWPKKRHAKNRLIQTPFVNEMGRILMEHGKLTLVTDDKDYSEQMTDVLQNSDGFESLYPAPYTITHIESYGSSYFDQLWREKGKEIHYHVYRQKAPAS